MTNRIVYYPNEKIVFNLDDINEQNGEEIFREIAENLQNNYVLSVNGHLFRFIEIEFYYWSPEHQDPFVYGKEQQKNMGIWCFHNSGIDITIGSSEKRYGGILIRRFFDLEKLEYTNGSWSVHDKIVSYFENAVNSSLNLSIVNNPKPEHQKPFGLSRIGLKEEKPKQKDGDPIVYVNRKYRFIIDIDNPDHKYLGRDEVRKYLKNNQQSI